jgi:4-amino-4-deoxychorismate lyase
LRIERRRVALPLKYHAERMNRTRREVFACPQMLDLAEALRIPDHLDDDVYKCRITYNADIQRIEFEPYTIRPVRSLQLIIDDTLDYHYKWHDRSRLHAHVAATDADDVLIVRNGYLTDTSYANIAFLDVDRWLTPAAPLLAGTRRQFLLDAGLLQPAPLRPEDLPRFQYARLLNAMLPWPLSPLIEVAHIRF